MKNIIILLILIFIGLIFPFLWLILFIDYDGVPLFGPTWHILAYFILWVLPLIYFHNKKIKFLTLKLIWINIIVFFILLFSTKYYADIYETKRWNIRIDESNVTRARQIIDIIEYQKKYDFIDLNSFNNLYSVNAEPAVNCYYLKWINNNTWFIFAYKYMSEENVNKYWKENYIYTNPSDYKVSTEEYNEITKLTNTYCFDDKNQYIKK